MMRYRVLPQRSRVEIHAKSSLHPIEGEATGLEGVIQAELRDGEFDLSTPPTMRIELPVDRLQSGNPLYDRELQRRIEARKYRRIRGESREVRKLEQRGQLDRVARYRVRGDLSFHGVTQPVEGDVTLTVPREGMIELEGEQTFDIRGWKVDPPRILALRVHPDVNVRLRLVAQREE